MTFSQLITHTGIYASGTMLVRLGHIALLPLWMKLLTPAEYGLLALLVNAQLIIKFLSFGGLISVATINLFHGTPTRVRYAIGSIITTHACIALPLLIMSAPVLFWANHLLFGGYATAPVLYALVTCCFFDFYQTLSHALLCNQKRATLTTITDVIVQFSGFALNYLFIAVLHKGVAGIIYAQLVTTACAAVIKTTLMCRDIRPYFVLRPQALATNTWKNLSTGFSFMTHSVSMRLLSNVDRWILLYYSSLTSVGLYSLASKLSFLGYECIIVPFLTAYRPAVFTQYQEAPAAIPIIERTRTTHLWLFLGICSTLLCIGYATLQPLAHMMLPHRFIPAIPLCFVLALEKIVTATSAMATLYLSYLKKISWFLALTFMSQCINITLDLALVTQYGPWGCAVASLIAALCYLAGAHRARTALCQQHVIGARHDRTVPHTNHASSQAHV